MPSTAESVSEGNRKRLTRLMVFDDDPERSAEMTAALAACGYHATDAGPCDGAAEVLTTDLSHAYVEENSAYSS